VWRAISASEALFARVLGIANDLGLLAEEYDPIAGRQTGNFPQALTHIALINTAHNISVAKAAATKPACSARSRSGVRRSPENLTGKRGVIVRGGGRSSTLCAFVGNSVRCGILDAPPSRAWTAFVLHAYRM